MVIKHIELHRIDVLRPVTRHKFNCGNGRRLRALSEERRAKVPAVVWSDETCATHEVIYRRATVHSDHGGTCSTAWESLLKTTADCPTLSSVGNSSFSTGIILPQDLRPDTVLLVHLAEGFHGRAPGSKILVHEGVAYFVLTWTDFFGAPIKECALERNVSLVSSLMVPGRGRLVYLQKTDVMSDEIMGS